MEMLRAFRDLVTGETTEAPGMLGDLRMMQGVRKFPQRVKCAMLAWRAVEQALLQTAGEATILTETDFAVPPHRGLPDLAAPIGSEQATNRIAYSFRQTIQESFELVQ